ncbi:MAG TPA: hypothetical protein PLT82_06390 [Candidatus Hydrogenedens sp.]|nr:hypothetical protein [Candidatus Hydrogenedens sp.]HOL19721.1 hypothetical protein [Candidatus Hydrogenedens sp.]HPP58744.1 hypothetical protein [Candidatus Hydrogenedens sp.]
MSDDSQIPKDKLRLCPICRMPISVWAIRCRFCGETVGRPKKEVETFTIEDLGGETPTEKTLSPEVLEAIEQFRQELLETPPEEEPPSMWNLWGTRQTTKKTNHAHKTTKKPTINPVRWIITFSITVLFIIMLYFFGPSIWHKTKLLIEGTPKPYPDYQNQALNMLERGEPIEMALAEALKAYEIAPSDENKNILNQVREKLINHIELLLTKDPYNPNDFTEASRIGSEVIKIDYDPKIQEIYRKVMDEISAYKMTLRQIDVQNKKATFTLSNLSEQTVSEGDLLQERFLVKQILSSRVRLEDTKIIIEGKPRRLSISLMSEIKADY